MTFLSLVTIFYLKSILSNISIANSIFLWFPLALNFFFFLIIYLAVLGLHCCARAFSSFGERGLLFVAMHGLLIAVASLVAEHGL